MDEVVMHRHALLLALAEKLCPSLNGTSSYRLAEMVDLGSLEDPGLAGDDAPWLERGLSSVSSQRLDYWHSELVRLGSLGVSLVDPRDPGYPANLRMVPDRPPFLFVRGAIGEDDARAVAVVGARSAGPEGLATAHRLAQELASRCITVISGLAEGVDTAAHTGALSAGGRTIAVFGTGINTVYPAKNTALADNVTNHGACVSQFWPDQKGARWSFPARNIVTSGLSLGTVVVEASETSGAHLQALAALKHGKRLFLLEHLVSAQRWAREMVGQPGVYPVSSVEEVIVGLETELTTDASVLV
jgi:DNA processing protein